MLGSVAHGEQGLWGLSGAEHPEVVAAGQSNALCLKSALDNGWGPKDLRAAAAYSTGTGSSPPAGDSYWDFVAAAGAGTIAVVWDGNQHNAAFLFRRDPPFQVHHSSIEPSDAEDAVWIPQEMIREFWSNSFFEMSTVLGRLAKGGARILVIGTPPPKPDAIIRKAIDARPEMFAEIARGLGAMEGILTPTSVRIALWEVIQTRMREVAGEVGAGFVPVPADAIDQAGLLLAAYCHPDTTHGNAEFGHLMWHEIASVLRTAPEPPAA
jgi:hypothetical protein